LKQANADVTGTEQPLEKPNVPSGSTCGLG
jgi:hypothetical protein